MYSSCTFCYRDLGRNQLIEHFPVGSRLAFDQKGGRLWVICPMCSRWNLSPLEERWEAIEASERAFRGATVRAATEHVALAYSREGTHLIRVGAPPRVELATWRYQDVFRRRWNRSAALFVIGAGVMAVGAFSGAYMAVATAVPGATVLIHAPQWLRTVYGRQRTVLRIPQDGGNTAIVRGRHVRYARLMETHDGWSLRIKHSRGEEQVRGTEALQLAAPLLANINAEGAMRGTVKAAIAVTDRYPEPLEAVRQIAARNHVSLMGQWPTSQALHSYSTVDRLALEMIASQEVETRALQGEIRYLERAWREADAIAAIADQLPAGTSVDAQLQTLKGGVIRG